MLLKLDLDKHKKELEKKKKEINILRSSRNLNLNLNNQTTYNINTSSDRINNYKGLKTKNSSKKNNNNTIMRTFISKTPEGLQRKGRRILLTKKSYIKPYLKKTAIINKSNKSINNDNSKDDEINNLNIFNNSNKFKKTESGTIDNIKIKNNISTSNIWRIKDKNNKFNKESKELTEKEDYKAMIIKLEKENESLRAENQKIKKNNHKSLNKDSSNNIDHNKF